MSEKYCVPIDSIPKLSNNVHEKIFEFYQKESINFKGFQGTVDENNRPHTEMNPSVGYAGFKLIRESHDHMVSLLEEEQFKLDYSKVYFVIQRVINGTDPHTDPGRYGSIIYHLQGKAITNFYEMKNFRPNISYTNEKIVLEESHIMDLHRWYLFNNSAIHEVKQVQGNFRLSFSISSISCKTFDEFKKELSHILL
jgi:hypothetical protein